MTSWRRCHQPLFLHHCLCMDASSTPLHLKQGGKRITRKINQLSTPRSRREIERKKKDTQNWAQDGARKEVNAQHRLQDINQRSWIWPKEGEEGEMRKGSGLRYPFTRPRGTHGRAAQVCSQHQLLPLHLEILMPRSFQAFSLSS